MRACGPYGPRGFESLSRRQPKRPSEKCESEKENDMKTNRILLVIVLLSAVASTLPFPVHAAQTLQTSGDARTAPLYTLRDKQVTLVGSGYASNQVYYIWVMGPKDNRTTYSGTSFTATSTGLIPPGGGL